eukprot:scaffold66826_cov45-Phaeocystis_antarctica.AAC.2
MGIARIARLGGGLARRWDVQTEDQESRDGRGLALLEASSSRRGRRRHGRTRRRWRRPPPALGQRPGSCRPG